MFNAATCECKVDIKPTLPMGKNYLEWLVVFKLLKFDGNIKLCALEVKRYHFLETNANGERTPSSLCSIAHYVKKRSMILNQENSHRHSEKTQMFWFRTFTIGVVNHLSQ